MPVKLMNDKLKVSPSEIWVERISDRDVASYKYEDKNYHGSRKLNQNTTRYRFFPRC